MPNHSIESLIARAATMADMHDQFVLPEEWLSWFNAERKALTVLKARSNWLDGALRTTSGTAIPSFTVGTDAAGTGPAAILGVWEVDASGKYRRLRRIDRSQAISMTGQTGTAHSWSYSKDNNNTDDGLFTIYLHPAPTSGTYITHYFSIPLDETLITDQVNLAWGEDERIVLGMAYRAKVKEEADTLALERMMAKWDAHVEEVAWMRAIADTPTVINRDFDQRGWTANLDLPPFASWQWL